MHKGDKQNLKSPKSQTSKRRVYFSELLKDAFVRWREKQSEDKKAAGIGWNEQGFIFTNAVGENLVDCLWIGNRAYLCVEMFDEPYVKRFCRAAVTLREPEPKRKPTFSAAEQISELLSGSGTTPTVKRVRRGA